MVRNVILSKQARRIPQRDFQTPARLAASTEYSFRLSVFEVYNDGDKRDREAKERENDAPRLESADDTVTTSCGFDGVRPKSFCNCEHPMAGLACPVDISIHG